MKLGNSQRSNTSAQQNSSSSRKSVQNRSIERAEKRMDSKNNQAQMIQSIVGQHNYSAEARKPPERGVMAYLRKKFQPLIRRVNRFREKFRESSRFIRRVVDGCLIGGMVIGLIGAHFSKQGITVPNSPVSARKTFINSDTIKLSNEIYDPANHTMRLNLKTTSTVGTVAANQITPQLLLAEGPDEHMLGYVPRRPVIDLIPTFNNHFVVIIHHLYKGFDGLKVQFHNRANITPSSLNDSLNAAQNNSSRLTDKQQELLEKVAQNGVTNYRNGTRERALIKKIERKNKAHFIIKEQYALNKHRGYVDPDESPEEIALNALRHHLKFDYKTIKANNKLIASEKNHIKYNQRRIRQINHEADTGGKQDDLVKVRQDIQNSQGNIKQYGNTKRKLQNDVNATLSLISRVNAHIAEIPHPAGKVNANVFHS